MKLHMLNRKSSGFSLIEVLIAVLVLATGMLALAALQSALIRNSVDAKNRTQAMSIAVNAIEGLRQNSSATIAAYNALAVGQTAWAPWQPPGGVAGAGATYSTNYESRQNVTRYVRDSNAAVCGGVANTPCFRPATAADGPSAGVAEFKRIDVDVRWSDAQGASRTISTSDIVGTTTDEKTDLILDQTGQATAGLGQPVARIPRPNERGIIPIAFGDNQETAASNPKPVTGRERGRTDETQFQVMTYSLDGDIATLNRVVDTRVLGCRCTLQGAGAVVDTNTLVGTPVQPTFWNGTEYSVPEDVANPQDGTRGRLAVGAAQNEELCTACCLDHHDRASNAVKFDPFRSHETLHNHYFDPRPGDDVVEFAEASIGDEYYEACRFIRVNGIFRVAQDMRLDLMNMLVTDPAFPDESVPLESAANAYADSVKDFVDQRIVQGIQDPVLNYPEVYEPGPVTLGVSDTRTQHNRGLYIDYLEAPALDAIANARSNCASGNVLDCVLPYVPVVSINTTEISQWRSTVETGIGDAVSVTNYGQSPGCRRPPCLVQPQAARGVLTGVAEGTESNFVRQLRSNSGVSDSLPIDEQDAALGASFTGEVFEDERVAKVGDACPPANVGNFGVDIPAATYLDPDSINVAWADPSSTSSCATESGQGCGDGGINPWTCKLAVPLPLDTMELYVSTYNRPTGRLLRNVDNTCTTVNTRDKVNLPECVNFQIANVNLDGTDLSPGQYDLAYANEGTVGVAGVRDGEIATLTFRNRDVMNTSRVALRFTGVATYMSLTCVNGQAVTECP